MSGRPIVREALAAEAVPCEGPVWSPARQRLLWADNEARLLHAFDLASGRNQGTAMRHSRAPQTEAEERR